MRGERPERIERLKGSLANLTDTQFFWVERTIQQLGIAPTYELLRTDLLTRCMLNYLGDAIRTHHCFSREPFTKDKFEHALEQAANACGKSAVRASRGNPGHDITIAGDRFSLKTQADKALKIDELYISKFMELGKGEWVLTKLLERFFAHMGSYERILDLRALSKAPQDWFYELVEIPKSLLEEARRGELEVMESSKQIQSRKPGYCRVYEEIATQPDPFGASIQAVAKPARAKPARPVKFELYFDGGTECKLQVKHIKKKYCVVHATWRFPPTNFDDVE